MSNSFYNSTFTAAIGTLARSSTLRSQFLLVEAGVTAMEAALAPKASPTFTGNATLANVAYTGTFTGGTGVLNIGAGQIYKDASGNTGFGTASPAQRVHVIGSVQISSGSNLQWSAYSAGATGELLYATSVLGIVMVTAGNERFRIKPSGSAVFVPMSAPSSPQEGEVYYDSSTHKHYGWNGSAWNAFY